MHGNLLISYFQKQRIRFLHHFYRTLKYGHSEDLHQLRVTIKRLRAVWSLTQMISKGAYSQKKHQKLIGPLYKQGGKLREAQVHLDVMKKLNRKSLKSAARYIRKKEKKAQSHLLPVIIDFDLDALITLDKKLESVIEDIPNKVLLAKSVSFISGKIDRVRKIMKELPNSKKLHKIRMHLKSVAAIQSIINEGVGDPKMQKFRTNTLEINELTGNWHDYDELLIMLDRYIRRNLGKREQKRVKNSMKKIELKQSSREKLIRKKLNRNLRKSNLKVLKQDSN